jgi:hypothetical protein
MGELIKKKVDKKEEGERSNLTEKEMMELKESISYVKNYENYNMIELKEEFQRIKEIMIKDNLKGGRVAKYYCEILNIDMEEMTNPVIKRECNKMLYKIITLHLMFVKNEIMEDECGESDYIFEFNKVFQIMYHIRDVLHGICNLEVSLDPLRDNELNTEIGASRFTPIDYESITPYQNLILYLLKTLYDKGYMRYGEFCYKRVYNNNNEFTYAWEEVCNIERYVYNETQKESQFEQWRNLTNDKGNFKSVCVYLQSCNDPQFRDLKKDRNIFSFRNGVYITKRSGKYGDYFYKYGDTPQLPPDTVSCKYFDVDFDNFEGKSWDKIETPNIQSILDYQYKNKEEYKEICKWMYIVLGRLLYSAGRFDDWQVMPFVRGVAGSGKCLLKGTEVMMSDGSVKKVEDIKKGDKLMGDDSSRREVLKLSKGYDKMYTISNTIGERYTVNSQHILSLKYGSKKTIVDRKDKGCYQIRWFDNKSVSLKGKSYSYKGGSKKEVLNKVNIEFEKREEDLYVDISIEKYLKLREQKDFCRMLKGYKKSVEFDEINVDIEPYLMGSWLGDKKTNNILTSSGEDIDVVSYLMKDLGILNNKYILDNYKFNSRINRFKLIAGIIDSCGKFHEKNNNFEIQHSNERVLEDVVYILQSLGLSAIKKGKKININGRGVEEIPTRRIERAKDKKYVKDVLVSAIKVKEYGIGEYFGFEITGNGRFLLSNFIVTHNSSILTQVVQKFYEPNDIGILSNDLEKTFGLSSIFDKYLFIGPEIKKDFALSQALLQSMISAEDVSIPLKHKRASALKWDIPGIMAGNELPNYQDSGGSISRRFLIFEFMQIVKASDSDPLLRLRLHDEIPAIIKKSNMAYLQAVMDYGDKNIWPNLPKFFQQTKDKLKVQTNTMQSFLSSGRLRFGKDLYCSESEFKKEFNTHCIDNNFPKTKYTPELTEVPFYEASEKYNIEIEIKRTKKIWPKDTGGLKHINFVFGIEVLGEYDDEE